MHQNLERRERIATLDGNLAIWKVHLDCLREQDKNARVMNKGTFDRLKENIKKDSRLESLPYVVKKVNQAGNDEFLIISGHHRVRAARAAGMQEVFVLVDEGTLSEDEIRSKQLAHNALAGFDDPQILADIYREIEAMEERIATGLTDLEKGLEGQIPVQIDDVAVQFEYEPISFLFLKKDNVRFQEILAKLEPGAKYLADKADFERFAEDLIKVSEAHDIRSISAIMVKVLDVLEEHLASLEKKNLSASTQS